MGWSSIARRRLGAAGLAIALVAAVVMLVLTGGGGKSGGGEESTTAPQRPAEPAGDPASELTKEELVDQVMLIGFEGDDRDADVVAEVRRHPVGGVLVFAQNWDGKAQGEKLIDAIRKAAGKGGGEAPLIATDQEGGPYRALDDLPPPERQIEIGDRGSAKEAEKWSRNWADALAAVGIDLNLAPVADVATLDTAIADRAFSDDPAVATDMTAAAVRGCREAGVACAVSHFPGIGSAAQDTSLGPAPIGLDLATLRTRDLVPFAAAFEAGAPAVVVSHGLYTAIDPVTPASLLPEVTTDLLRDELAFRGVAISDDIGAGAITAIATPADAAVEAMNAGIDLIQVAQPEDVAPVRRALLAALADGTLSEERLREAAGRVLALKRELAGTQGSEGKGGKGKKGDGGRPRGEGGGKKAPRAGGGGAPAASRPAP